MTVLNETMMMRYPAGTIERANKLAKTIGNDPQFNATGKVTKSLVLRVAALKGLELLEEKYMMKTGKQSR